MVDERYGLTFVGKRDSIAALERPTDATLIPREDSSIDFDAAQDVLIEGDSLEVLKILAAPYFGKVQMIYVDPPYNTGKDFVFRDSYAESRDDYLHRSGQVDEAGGRLTSNPETSGRYHSAWLSMMYPRLVLARQLLREDGLFFVSIDDHEVHNLRLLLDEVFGQENFIAQITLVSNRGGRDYMKVALTHEYLLCYGRDEAATVRELPKEQPSLPHEDGRGPYALRELRNRNPRFSPKNRPNLFFPVHVHPGLRDPTGCCAIALEPATGHEVTVEPRNSRGEDSVWRWSRDRLQRALVPGDPVASDVVARQRSDGGWNVYEKHRKSTTKVRSVWDDKELRSERGTHALRELFGELVFDHPKPVELIRRCLQLGTDEEGIVLDFFAGSGTTAQAVLELNQSDGGSRRYVLVQLPEPTPEGSVARQAGFETIFSLCHERIRRVLERLGPGATPGLRTFSVAPSQIRRVWRGAATEPDEYLGSMERTLDRVSTGAGDFALLWEILLRSGLGLDAHVRPLPGMQAGGYRAIDPDSGRTVVVCLEGHLDRLSVVVCLEGHLDRKTVERLDLPRGTRLVCLDRALDDEVATNLARRFTLETI
jgi:adenine-specific DNA-methyltransferase